MYDSIKRSSQMNNERRIVIDEVNPSKLFVTGHDAYKKAYRVTFDFHDATLAIPVQGEMWVIQQYSNEWRLMRRAETGNEATSVKDLKAGDRRLEANNDLYLNGQRVLINGVPFNPTKASIGGAWGSISRFWGTSGGASVPPYPGSYLYDMDWTGGHLKASDETLFSWDVGSPTNLAFGASGKSFNVTAHLGVTIYTGSSGLTNYHPMGLELFAQCSDDMTGNFTNATSGGQTMEYVWGSSGPTVVNAVRYTSIWIGAITGISGMVLGLANLDSTNVDAQVYESFMRFHLNPIADATPADITPLG